MQPRADTVLMSSIRGATLGLALALAACSTTAPASRAPVTRGQGATAVVQSDAAGFQLKEKVRVPADARADYDNAMRLVDAGQYEPGITLLQKVTQKAPAAAAAYVDLGIAYGRSGDLDHAVASLKRAVELNPRQLVAYNELGMIYRRKGEFTAARDSYEKALGIYPGFHYARLNLAILCDVYLADLACAQENYAAYQRLVPDDAQAAAWLTDLNTRAGH